MYASASADACAAPYSTWMNLDLNLERNVYHSFLIAPLKVQ